MQVMSLAQLLLPQVLSKPDILHASRLPRLTEAGAARASECTDSSGEKACKGGPGSERDCRTGRWMVGNSIILVCLHAVVRETHKGDRSLQFYAPPPRQAYLSRWDPPSYKEE